MICRHCIYFFNCVHFDSIISSDDFNDLDSFECCQFHSIYCEVLDD